MGKGRYGSMTIETAPWYRRKLEQQRKLARQQRRARPRPARASVEYDLPTGKTLRARAESCGGVQHRETKSAGQTTGGACGGTRLGNPCDEDGLTR